jgi:hypothetical protein
MSRARLAAFALIEPDHDQAIALFTGPLRFRLAEDIAQRRPDGTAKRWVTVVPPGAGGKAGAGPGRDARSGGSDRQTMRRARVSVP